MVETTVETVPIDATGEVLRFEASGVYDSVKRVDLNLDGGESADYAVDVGVDANDDGTITWFDEHSTHTGVTSVRDGWDQTEPWLRIRVTTASATSGMEATVFLSANEY